ncbi:plasmid recombination enzyme [Eubacterium sp. CAG:115]|nr:plasmid recombination enzyme [Eubacterium sp. CAG:115]
MAEQTRNGLSVSFRLDDGIVEHNNREFIAKNVVRERIPDNITYKRENIREFYNQLFGQALAEYNARKAHPYQRIPDYYEHIGKGKQEKPYEEIVVQFGDMQDCGLNSENWETAKAMLDEYMREFERRNPNLKVFNAVMHLDEATPHLHIDFVPIVHSPNRGLPVRVSMKGALREQGFSSANRMENEWVAWQEAEREYMEEILHKYGLHRDDKNVHREHWTVDEYKRKKQAAQEIRSMNDHINALKKKSDDSYTSEEISAIKNQNDYMRSEITKRDEKIAALSRQVNADFVPYEIYSDDKLQYVADGLTRAKIPFIEESRMLYIPDYAVKTANAIASHYQSANVGTIRDRIALDIDRLIYSSMSVENLLSKLKERGYEIKHGKYIAVKSPFAERYVRLKSLGDEYLTKKLEKRISLNGTYARKVKERMSRSSEMEKKICSVILDTTVAIQQFRIIPKKTKPQKIYTFSNDESLNLLVEQLSTIGEFGIASRDGIYAKAEELKNSIDEKTEELKALSNEAPTLKSEIAQIRFYFENVQNRRRLDSMGQIRLAAAKEVVDKHGIRSVSEIAELEERLKLLPTYIRTVQNKLAEEQARLKRVNRLADVYESVIEGNYIDNLIRENIERQFNNKLCKCN